MKAAALACLLLLFVAQASAAAIGTTRRLLQGQGDADMLSNLSSFLSAVNSGSTPAADSLGTTASPGQTALTGLLGEVEQVVNEATSTVDGYKGKLLDSFGKDSPLSNPQVGAIVQDLIQLYLAVGGF